MVPISPSLRLSAALRAAVAVLHEVATPTPECCNLLARAFPADVSERDTKTWNFENNNFWSATEIRNPTCVFLPDSTEKVAEAVTLFVQHKWRFAVKGGGHSAIPQAANIDGGVLMPMHRLNSTAIDFERGALRVGTGVLMGDIYAALDPHNLTAMIGRYEKVGMGLAMGAGFSYLVNREGLAIDNILDYEVVLADGSVVNANAGSNSDLFRALKGGNNNFGVVTHVTLATVQTEGAIYGGVVYYPESSLPHVTDQIYDHHTRQAIVDTSTHVLPQYGYNGTTNETISFCPIIYNRAVDELPEVLRGWIGTSYTKSSLKKRQYHDLSVELNAGFPDGLVQEQRVFSAYADANLYRDVWAAYHQWLQKYQHIPGLYGLHVNMPITPHVIVRGSANGGNSLGLQSAGNRTLGALYFGITLDNMSDAPEVLPAHGEFVRSMENLAKSRGLWHPYIMLTYSGYDQPAIASYGPENVAFLRKAQEKYNPDHVFQRLVPGGQKPPSLH
ncbi:FAD-binding domain-containing protein [Trichocladium antarcticum]|uniref:FAD-binding domain-containing protein n=1 Tax=Trichocladium antarcticum TaxID=1450529 RepID=A0AAN6ULD7_9PEZI|nr:FAD-binding domain-containing protein [Trichocladium antarcticum]